MSNMGTVVSSLTHASTGWRYLWPTELQDGFDVERQLIRSSYGSSVSVDARRSDTPLEQAPQAAWPPIDRRPS